MLKKKIITLCVLLSAFATSANANTTGQHPLYIGLSGGYGSTTWGNLASNDPASAMSYSTPLYVHEGGTVWGGFVGYEFFPQFALEMSYLRYPDARLTFSTDSLFYYDHDQTEILRTKTSRTALSAKFMLYIPHSKIRAFSSFGLAGVYRSDSATKQWRMSPMFGVGLNYDLTNHIMFQISTEYVAGYGQPETDGRG